jgi:dipeptidyl aminopeptidase/acylaminoacyl peptidase
MVGMSELTAELLAGKPFPESPIVSPDGRLVAYLETTWVAGGISRSALWVAAADGGSPPVRLTEGESRDRYPQWAPGSEFLYLASDQELRRIGAEGGADDVLLSWRGQISGCLPLADGRRVAVLATDEPDAEDERRQAERDDALVWSERKPGSRLRLLDLETRELATVGGLGDRHVVHVAQRPDGGPLAVISWDCPEDEPGAFTARLHVVEPDADAVSDLGPTGLWGMSPAWWTLEADWHLAYMAVTPPGPIGNMAVFDVAVDDEQPQRRNLTAGLSICPVELTQVAGGPPLALFADGLDTALCRLEPETQRFSRLATWTGDADSLSASDAASVIAVRASTAYEPYDVHAGAPTGALTRISDTRPELRRVRWGRQERLAYQAADGLELDGLLILPPGMSRGDGPFPLITHVHGGPDDRSADKLTVGWWYPGQWLAAGGYAVFLPNPRGGLGHGPEFAAAVAGAVGTDEWTDILTGIDLLIAEGVADPDRLGIGGWSHGGFMTAWAVGHTDRFRAAVMGAGIADWGMQTGVGELGLQEAGLGGGTGWEGPGPHRHDQLSPISYAANVRTPVLIVHGEEDTNVPVGQAIYFHRALSFFGVEHELVLYPREGHPIRERNHQIDLLTRARAWFDRWLLGAPAEAARGSN